MMTSKALPLPKMTSLSFSLDTYTLAWIFSVLTCSGTIVVSMNWINFPSIHAIWILESFEGSDFWWNKDPEIIPKGLAWSRKQLFKRSNYSLLFGKVNLDLTPTISEQQTVWYMAFHKFYMSYIPMTPPTTYMDLFDDYIKKLSASRKRGKIDTRELLIIHSSGCWEELNEEFNELCQTKFFVNGATVIDLDFIDDLVKDYLIQEESRLKQKEKERCCLEEHKMMEALFLKTLQQEVQRHDEKEKMLNNGKRTQRSSAFVVYYWGNTFAMAEKNRPLNSLNDQDMNLFIKDVTPWVEATDKVYLTDAFDIFLGRQGPLRCRFPWCKDHVKLWVNYMWHVRPHDADWAMVSGYFVELLLQDSIPSWNADGTMYKVSWCDVKEVFMPINETDQHWCFAYLHIRTGLVTFYDSSVTYDLEWREWMIVSVPTPFYTRLLGFNSDEQLIIEVDDIGYQMDTTL
nr:hypothetical protein [Tanacetum cinerariifolium]